MRAIDSWRISDAVKLVAVISRGKNLRSTFSLGKRQHHVAGGSSEVS